MAFLIAVQKNFEQNQSGLPLFRDNTDVVYPQECKEWKLNVSLRSHCILAFSLLAMTNENKLPVGRNPH